MCSSLPAEKEKLKGIKDRKKPLKESREEKIKEADEFNPFPHKLRDTNALA